ncbi:hypothetical protein COU19_00315 [Candidatus Kaiserbacteria bacterium CG10_big_fil_rev_8_21_14_0_10_56_12]|uniref:Uncharacterized protein n=1 Tax=Candidatus Kaiserbacteria bacterium CG10_big_fil_rev_8_21_14_0_10_56_12 TaxID=1974611 RepID=A0A2H0UAP4_9BACT|nr:MAG: hypothetical protein COU19_00315 [Candidatus Kaiserbacteria bacterium CG10_big_fil_rev_8_21_14_0_10_56_12]
MCFSATASLVAGTALTATGAVTIAKTKHARELPFTSMPLIFGLQQLTDGVAWLSFNNPFLHTLTGYGYAFFAYLLWPVLIPFSVWMIEPNPRRRRYLRIFLALGIIVSLYALYLMLSGPVTARVINECIRYDTYYPYSLWMFGVYLVATSGSCFVSSRRLINLFGVLTLISVAVAAWFYLETFSSVWCFFASLLSFLVYWYVRDSR